MTAWLRHPVRVSGRLLWLAAEMAFAAFDYGVSCAFHPPTNLDAARAQWLQRAARRTLRIFRVAINHTGEIPSKGLLVCNHLGYLDVLVLAALTPCVFVAKSEVKGWPLFGWFAKRAGTLFVRRDRRFNAGQTVAEIEKLLRDDRLVVLFPEGTSSGGQSVLPFKSSLLEAVAQTQHPVTAAFLKYDLADGNVSEEICYWGDMTLVPHLINLSSKRSIGADLYFQRVAPATESRKELARQLHSDISRLQSASLLRAA